MLSRKRTVSRDQDHTVDLSQPNEIGVVVDTDLFTLVIRSQRPASTTLKVFSAIKSTSFSLCTS